MFESNSGGGTHCSLVLFAPKDKRRSDPYSYNSPDARGQTANPFLLFFVLYQSGPWFSAAHLIFPISPRFSLNKFEQVWTWQVATRWSNKQRPETEYLLVSLRFRPWPSPFLLLYIVSEVRFEKNPFGLAPQKFILCSSSRPCITPPSSCARARARRSTAILGFANKAKAREDPPIVVKLWDCGANPKCPNFLGLSSFFN